MLPGGLGRLGYTPLVRLVGYSWALWQKPRGAPRGEGPIARPAPRLASAAPFCAFRRSAALGLGGAIGSLVSKTRMRKHRENGLRYADDASYSDRKN